MKRIFLTLLAAVAVLAAACQLSGTTTPGPQPVGSPTAAGPTAASATAANPQALTIKWPAPGEGVEASPLLQWDDFPGAAHYQVTLLDSASNVILQQDSSYAHFRVSPPLTKGARYAWQVQAHDASHVVLAQTSSQFSVKDDLVLGWPPLGEAVDSSPLLQWQAFPGAVQYRVLVVTGPADSPQVVVDQVVQQTQFAVTPPLKPGSYRWTVRALDAKQVVAAELNGEFSVKDHLELLEPADGAVVGATPTIRWAVYPGAVRYQVLLTDSSAQPPAAVMDVTTKGTETNVNTTLKPDTNYTLTVRALNDARKVLADSNSSFRVYATGAFYDCGQVHALPAAECQALVALYQATGGTGWTNTANWLSTDTPCDWPGVTCTDGHVTNLTLFSNKLKGRLPAALADLTALQALNLHDNQLTGSIPPELGRLASLTELNLSQNQLSGGLPAELSQLHSLTTLLLSSNQLSGELPTDWQPLAALTTLDLSRNSLTGAIPAGLSQLPQLQTLRLGYNHFSGILPAELGQLAQLTELDVSYNQLSGAVSEAALRLPTRALWGNELEGTVRCDGSSPAAIDFQGVHFACSVALAASVWPEVMPAIAPSDSTPYWVPRPEHVRFTLAVAPEAALHAPLGAALSDQAQVVVYPVQDYNALDRAIRLQTRDLQTLLEQRPAAVDGPLPLLPLNNGNQMLHARLHYLDFANGSGVAFLTQYAMGVEPVNNQELFYAFQGLTADNKYLVGVFVPVRLPGLPDTPQMSDSDLANLMADYKTYLAGTAAMLDGQTPETFAPDLAQIDQLIQSLVVHGGAQ